MKINNFIKELETALIERGVQEDAAKKHIATLVRSFTKDDIAEIEAIETSAEVNTLADSIAVILNKTKKSESTNTNSSPSVEFAPRRPQKTKVSNNSEKIQPGNEANVKVKQQERKLVQEEYEPDYFNDEHKQPSNTRGKTIFWFAFCLTLPISLALVAIVFGAFIAVFGALIGLIIASVALIVAIVAIGAAASLVGIIYGVTQLYSFPAAGIYEIGLGIIVAGAVLMASILIYNFAIRFIPWVISWLAVFFKYSCRKLVVLFNYARKECYKL